MRICTWDAVAFPGRSASESRDAPAADETRAERTAVDAETWRDVASDESLSTSRRVNEKSRKGIFRPVPKTAYIAPFGGFVEGLGSPTRGTQCAAPDSTCPLESTLSISMTEW